MDAMHPFLQLILLSAITIVCLVIFTLGAMYLVKPLFGITALDVITQGAIDNPGGVAMNANQINALKFVQFMSSFGIFIIPPLAFARLKFPDGDYLRLNVRTPLIFLLLGVLILLFSGAFIEFIYSINRQLPLPQWMVESEHASEQITLAFLKTPRPADIWINLIVLALIPAIGEELMFRGCVQQLLREWTRNTHAAIWITAFLFSFIHFQFYGFVPRMILGALLGYLFVWSGSLWVPIIAHAFNNGIQIVLAYLYDHKKIEFDITSEQQIPVYITIVASAGCLLFMYLYKRISDQKKFIY